MGAVHAQAPCHRGRLGTLGERAGDHHRERGGHPDALRLRRLPPPELHPEIRHPGCHRPGASNRRRARRNHAHPPVRRSGTGPWRVHTADGDVPVVQVSVSSLEPAALLALGQRLRALRDEGILVIGSGFMTRGFEIMRDPGLTSYPHRLRRMGHRRLQPRRLRHAERLPSQGTRSRHRTPHLRPLRPPCCSASVPPTTRGRPSEPSTEWRSKIRSTHSKSPKRPRHKPPLCRSGRHVGFVGSRVAYVAAATMDFAAALRGNPSALAMPAWGLKLVQSATARIFGPRCAAGHR